MESTVKTAQRAALPGNILVVDDDPLIVRSLHELLRHEGYRVETASSGREALERLAAHPCDLVITDVNMPEMDGTALLRRIKEAFPSVIVILVTGYGTIESAVDAVKAGAYHYISKPLIDDEIKILLARALEQKQLVSEQRRLKQENESLRQQLGKKFQLGSIIGRDYKMQRVFETVQMVGESRATVLITGESGTGKTVIARAIHHNSNRRSKPFVEINCGALPETLLESELFGHARGAFTGAFRDKIGKFQTADGGTIFLDEISTSSQALQVKLLRVLQDHEFEKIGQHETIRVDVRVILATNTNLAKEVEKGSFREDLFYRINVVTMELPPLRERLSDIELLANHFLEHYCRENGKNIQGIHESALEVMRHYSWPGNVRELENVIERAVVLGRNDTVLPEDLPPALHNEETAILTPSDQILPLKEALSLPEKRIIERALRANKWNRQKTAAMLKVNRTTLFNKMKKYGLLAE
jgi:DNA-binding NtrC family response regulator